jgi:hypothetical protein
MIHGKTINIFLIDGDPNGRMSCELSNWSGKAYKIPRIKVKECTDRDDLSSTGVYLLLGKDEEEKDLVYIGEGENILARLNQHYDKEFWKEVIVFISKDDNLNKAHIKYLENRLHNIATEVKRYNIKNSSIPTQSSISESDKAEMEEFIQNIKILVNALGHKLFEDKREIQSSAKQVAQFTLTNPRENSSAIGMPTSEGFVVFKGAILSKTLTPKVPAGLQKQREDLIKTGKVILKGENYVLTDDTLFTSPSAAAGVILGKSSNGLTEWRINQGLSLKDYYQ